MTRFKTTPKNSQQLLEEAIRKMTKDYKENERNIQKNERKIARLRKKNEKIANLAIKVYFFLFVGQKMKKELPTLKVKVERNQLAEKLALKEKTKKVQILV